MFKHPLSILLMGFALHAAAMGPAAGGHGFVPDRGQLHDQHFRRVEHVRYLWAGGRGLNVQVLDHGLAYDTYGPTVIAADGRPVSRFHRLEMRVLGATGQALFRNELPADDHLNFHNAVTPPKGATGVPHFGRVVQEAVLPGVDLVHGLVPNVGYKYDLVLRSADALDDLRLEYVGHDAVELRNGELHFDLGGRVLVETIPACWWTADGLPLEIGYRVLEQAPGRVVVGFSHAGPRPHGHASGLVIDPMPVLEWGTYFGTDGADAGTAVVCDTIGMLYTAGRTDALVALATTGAHQVDHAGGGSDAYVAHFAFWGARIWCTYYGGEGLDEATGLTVENGPDGARAIYVVGNTTSAQGMATDSVHQTQYADGADVFVAKFSAQGVRLWASYLGGPLDDAATGCAADEVGGVYVVGHTGYEGLFDSIAGNLLNGHAGGTDAFILRFDTAGHVLHAAFHGGPEDDRALAVARNSQGAVVMVGTTTSTMGLATAGVHQEELLGPSDAFLACYDTLGGLSWSSYLGGDGTDVATGVVLADGFIYATGYTDSSEQLADTTVAQPAPGGGMDAFITCFRPDGERLWFSYFGGDGDDRAHGMACDRDGDIYIVGTTTTAQGMATADPWQGALAGGTDVFMARFDSLGAVEWSTYYGGGGDDHGAAVAVYGYTVVFIAGSTSSTSGIALAGLQMANGGGDADALLARFIQDRSTPPDGVCTAPGGGGGGGGSGGGGTAPPGTSCAWQGGSTGGYVICLGETVTLTLQGGALGWGHVWMWYANDCGNPATFLTMGDTLVITPTQSLVVHVRAESALSYTHCSSVMITVEQPISVTALPVDSLCAGAPIQLSAFGATCYQWTGPGGFHSLEQHVVASSDTLAGNYQYVVTGYSELGGCSATDTVEVTVMGVPAVQWTVVPETCHGSNNGTVAADSLHAATLEFLWVPSGAVGPLLEGLGADTLLVMITTPFGCTAQDTVVITGVPHPVDSVLVSAATCGADNGAIAVELHPDAPDFSVTWPDLGLSGAALADLAGGIYQAMVSDGGDCLFTITVQVPDTGQVTVSFVPDTLVIAPGGQVLLSPLLDGPVLTYAWAPPNGLDCTDCASPTAAPLVSTTYVLNVISPMGCAASATVQVEVLVEDAEEEEEEEEEEAIDEEEQVEEPTVIRCPELFVPSMFTPNGDGVNDGFGILGGCLEEMHLVVFNRWGQQVFETRDRDLRWDGTYRGAPLNGGAVQYLLTGVNDQGEAFRKAGIVTIVR